MALFEYAYRFVSFKKAILNVLWKWLCLSNLGDGPTSLRNDAIAVFIALWLYGIALGHLARSCGLDNRRKRM